MFDKLKYKLMNQRDLGLYRSLKNISTSYDNQLVIADKIHLNFASNDYLGLNSDKKHIALLENISEGLPYGIGASRVVTGNRTLITDIEARIASFFGYEDALLFNSGYMLNSSLFKNIFD